ncbi:MAG: PmoA family protein [Opitutales bacterium]
MLPLMLCFLRFSSLFFASFLFLSGATAREYQLAISAGEKPRLGAVASFSLPGDLDGHPVLLDSSGADVALQQGADGKAFFFLPRLEQGETATFVLKGDTEGEASPVTVETVPDNGRLKLSVEGVPVLYYQAEKREFPRPGIDPIYARGGFIHPLLSPSGKVLTDSYPEDHVHHHGIWAPWTRTEFEERTPDFWNMAQGSGTVEFVEIDETWSGAVHGGFQTRHQFVDLSAPEPVVALNETWTVKVYNGRDDERAYNIFDLTIVQETASSSPLTLPEYHYGGLGFRGNGDWVGNDNTFFLTSNGETDRVAGHATRADWCHIGGEVDGDLTGVAILGHPGNFRAPQPMRLHPNEPFFCYAPSQLGDWEITPEEPYVARYRFVTMDGPPDQNELDQFWNAYAHPVEVKIEAR